MPLTSGQHIELTIEKPAAGGRMIARHEGQVILVQGGIPGERVRAAIERVERQVAFAETREVLEPSADRVSKAVDLACGGCLYAHIAYARQTELKAEVIRDAFARLGRLPIEAPRVAPSPVTGYRMRARLHVKGGRAGFYREGTHELCDAGATGQLAAASIDAVTAAVHALADAGCTLSAVELTENIPAEERVLYVVPSSSGDLTDRMLDAAASAAALTGCTGQSANGTTRTAGVPYVADALAVLTKTAAVQGVLQRRAESFFQANRFLLPELVAAVLASIPGEGEVLDLYAGVGLFSVCLAAVGRTNIVAIEGDRASGADLLHNAAPFRASLDVHVESVERYVSRLRRSVRAILVDPPRTGISREAMEAIVRTRAGTVVYVSCDPATMARDARRLVDGGYELQSMQAFDLFPNTPHVESLGVFARV